MNSVLDLIFLRIWLKEFNDHFISSDLWSSLNLDYALLSVSIILDKEFIQEKKRCLIKNSVKFINKLRCKLGSVKMSNITSYKTLEYITQEFALIAEDF